MNGRSSIFLEAFALTQAIGELLGDAMAGGPLTPEEYAAYSVVFEEEAVTPTDMGRRLGMPKTTVMERVRLMEARGHVRRVPQLHDGRSYRLVLTASGLSAHRRAHDLFEAAYQAFLREFSGNIERAQRNLTRIRASVAEAGALSHRRRTRA